MLAVGYQLLNNLFHLVYPLNKCWLSSLNHEIACYKASFAITTNRFGSHNEATSNS